MFKGNRNHFMTFRDSVLEKYEINAANQQQIVINFYNDVYLPAQPADYYEGKPLEGGGTSISKGMSPSLRRLVDEGIIKKGMKICDYGAGKFGANANPLRKMGIDVYAYDPFNGTGSDGWHGISTKLPKEKFDLCFTSYVLNVVPEAIERSIIAKCKRLAPVCYHVVRNFDIYDTVKKALLSDPSLKDLSKEEIVKFCIFGTQTSRGFQRIPMLERKGWKIVMKESGWKLYGK
jgi:hypothetical protein